ncbi:hypothetical protein [Solibacillus isronensis]|uniref:hypothetical protein n=1 Tax=Solibacillus isronensis TaxID=412383 RepID=UPI002041E2DE|nr:hypothetical protein [Solibacillus isronensis]MCM3723988.1 hypothetical protein [Solibacillus isronensis]
MLLHEFELDLLEQILKYTYLRAVELVDYFDVIREKNGFLTDDIVRARQNLTLMFSEQLSEYVLKTLLNQWLFNLESALLPLNY